MRTPKTLYPQSATVYSCELETCPTCGSLLVPCDYHGGHKTVQTMSAMLEIAYRPKISLNPTCTTFQSPLKSAEWQQIAPLHGTYGFDVIATIGWQRQTYRQPYAQIHTDLTTGLQISESQVRYLYIYQYLPLLACHEREYMDELKRVSATQGLILTLDGLAPQGGEPSYGW